MTIINCQECNKEILKTKHNKKYCSDCRIIVSRRIKQNSKKRIYKPNSKTSITINCQECNIGLVNVHFNTKLCKVCKVNKDRHRNNINSRKYYEKKKLENPEQLRKETKKNNFKRKKARTEWSRINRAKPGVKTRENYLQQKRRHSNPEKYKEEGKKYHSEYKGVSDISSLYLKNKGSIKRMFRVNMFKSNLEALTYYILKEMFGSENILYEVSYKWLGRRRIDFVIINQPRDILIEVNGQLHYNNSFGEKRLLKQQENDKIKAKLCKENNKPLIILKYDEKITKELIESKLNLISS